ncbi:MAG: PqqD family protein [Acidobacteria bacterium]|nr:PqqD family protein [Acidobacteriota bacterium]
MPFDHYFLPDRFYPASLAVPPSVRILSDAEGRGGVLLDSTRGVYLMVNRSGVEIWSELEGGHQPIEIANILAERWHRETEEVDREVKAFVQDLVRRGMLVTASDH